ncbi:winged helix-turn-helix transcriptional regulator [Patescibacteria group bacterium AH-259-L05]|nr:winged helix-turn-helix transcriptional regulator [Patescibacteria group bacterium AH-259-L05]
MIQKLHPKQKIILNVLKKGVRGMTLRDIAQEIGVNSPNTALYHINQLEKKGYLRRNPAYPQDYTVLKDPVEDLTYVNLYGMAQCGPNGLLVQENVIDRIPLSTKVFGVSDQVFLVKARGDSMEPRIFENDLVLAVKQTQVRSGQLGIVIHNHEAKIKKIIFAGKHIVLESLNPKYTHEVVKKDENFHIVGEVKNIIHFTSEGN